MTHFSVGNAESDLSSSLEGGGVIISCFKASRSRFGLGLGFAVSLRDSRFLLFDDLVIILLARNRMLRGHLEETSNRGGAVQTFIKSELSGCRTPAAGGAWKAMYKNLNHVRQIIS